MPHALPGIPELTWWYPIIAFILLAIAFIAIPRRDLKGLFYDSLMWGFVVSLIFGIVLTALRIYRYEYQGPFTFLGAPVWLALAWSPTIMVYLYFKPPMQKPVLFWSYILAFSLLSAVLDQTLHQMGLLTYFHWSSAHRFVAATVWFWLTAYMKERYTR